MAKIDVRQINKNRQVMQDSTIDSPYVPQIEDSDADYGVRLFDFLPKDRVGLMPITEKEGEE